MEEEWTDIYFFNQPTNKWIDFRGYYQVSTLGRLRSVDRYVRGYNHGTEYRIFIKGKILKCRNNVGGYPLAHLGKEGKHYDYSLHRLVYFSFNPEADTNMQVNHMDENKENCSLSNLNLMTAKENANWGTRTDRIKEKVTGVSKGKMPEYHKKLISKGLKNSVKAKESRKRAAEKTKIPIVQLDLNGNYVNDWDSAADAEKVLRKEYGKRGIFSQSIIDCCRGKRHTCGGFKWKYKRDCV